MDKNKISIAIDVRNFPIRYLNFLDFIELSPELGYINFIGDKMFTDSEELPDVLELCAKHGITVEFSNLAVMAPDVVSSLVSTGCVARVTFVHAQEQELKPVIDEIIRLRNLHKSATPAITCLVDDDMSLATMSDAQNTSVASDVPKKTVEPVSTPTSFGFYDLDDNLKDLPCTRLLGYPLLDFDGRFVGCWENYQDTPINAFQIGIAAALEHKFVKRMCKMLYTGRPDVDIPCMRCPVFMGLTWNNKRIRLVK